MLHSYVGSDVLVARHHCVLLVYRERSGKIRWELPSGLIKPGESLEQAAQREMLEETGIVVSLGALLCTVLMEEPTESYRGINAYFHAATLDEAVPRPGLDEPIHKAEYVDVSSLRARDIHPVDRRILNMWKRKPSRPPFYLHVKL